MSYQAGEYDVIVIGAGHSGCEAALASARLGLRTLILTISFEGIALMPCNPSIGGPAKGHLVREVDALGGQMAKVADISCLQRRVLNTAKGPAVRALRFQIDKTLYQKNMRRVLEKTPNLDLRQAVVNNIFEKNGIIEGVLTETGAEFRTKALVVTTGTYLRGKIIIGDFSYDGGPGGLRSANLISDNLRKLGIKMHRFNTGTPARVDRRSIDFAKMVPQFGEESASFFSFAHLEYILRGKEQMPCWLTHTNEETHLVIRKNISRSPLHTGFIEGVGPRYCPSIENKVVRFPDKLAHQIFLEPEGFYGNELYVQGMYTSLPEDVQVEMLRTIPGMEKVRLMRCGYAIEYDCIDPTQLKPSLALKSIEGVFFAGQVNGTSGYEEAAAQGLVAGINAALFVKGKDPMVLGREQAYTGVLVDDLVMKGTQEPYRMFTSRAEYRLLLRHDNADMRLTPVGYRIGLVSKSRFDSFSKKQKMIEQERLRMERVIVTPTEENQEKLRALETAPLRTPSTLAQLLRRPELNYQKISEKRLDPDLPDLPDQVREQVELQIKYSGYIKKQEEQVKRFKRWENKKISPDFVFSQVKGISSEALEKLEKILPSSLGEASRIPGITPADISLLHLYVEQSHRRKHKKRGCQNSNNMPSS